MRLKAFFLAVVVLTAAHAPSFQNIPEKQAPFTFALDVDQVVLGVSVLDRKRGFVSGLQRENFEIYENGRLQEIESFAQEDIPVTIGLVVDASGSMRTKRSEVVSAALAFIQASNPLDEMFIVTFNDDVTFALEDEGFSSSIARLRRAILGLTCTGRTALYDGLAAALQHLEKGQYERKALLVVSDGHDNISQRKFDEVLEMVKRSNALVYTIALYDEENRERNKKVLERMSKAGGGEFFGPLLLTEIGEICQRIAKDIRNLYTVAYKPRETPHDGSYRAINVIVKTPGREKLIVRAREGYFSPVRPKAENDQRP